MKSTFINRLKNRHFFWKISYFSIICSLLFACSKKSGSSDSSSTGSTNDSTTTAISATNSSISFSSSSLTAGGTITATITLRDSGNNPVANQSITIASTGSSNSIIQPILSTDSNGQATASFSSTKAESKTISIATPVALNSVSGSLTVYSATTSQFSISNLSSSLTAGISNSVTISAMDSYSNISNYNGTIHFTSSDTQAILVSDYTFVGSDNGVHSFSGIVFKTAGTQNLTVTDTSLSSLTKTQSNIQVSASNGSSISIVSGDNQSATVHTNITNPIVVQVRDAYNNLVNNQSVSFSISSGAGLLSSCSSSTNSSGQAQCSSWRLGDTAGTNQVLVSINSGAQTLNFTATGTAGSPSTTYSSVSATGPVAANGSSTSTITVILKDAYNNPCNSQTPSLSITNSYLNNQLSTCSATDTNGVSTCTLSSYTPETKSISLNSPISISNASSVVFSVPVYTGENNPTASVVIGEPDFTSNNSSTDAMSLNHPTSLKVYNRKLWIVDSYNNRILRYSNIPSSNGPTAEFVLGQADFISSSTGTTSSTFNEPRYIEFSPDGKMFITDFLNNRVLIYNQIPSTSQTAADVVIGQSNMTSNSSGCSSNQLNSPQQVKYVNGKLVISDSGNYRVLIYNSVPTSNGASADLVLGQADMNSCANSGAISASNLGITFGIASDTNTLFVTDSGNSRIMYWTSFPTTTNQSSNISIGTPDLYSSDFNSNSMIHDLGGNSFISTNSSQILVTDWNQNRLLIYNQYPSKNLPIPDLVIGSPNLKTNYSGISSNLLYSPMESIFIGDSIAVADAGNSRVLIFNKSSPTTICNSTMNNNSPFASGSGSANDPYTICTATQLQNLVTSTNITYLSSYYKLLADIDLTGITWNPSSSNFAGGFDGTSHTIKNLNTNFSANYKGLFGKLNSASIHHLNLDNFVLNTSASYLGILAGTISNGSAIYKINITNSSVLTSSSTYIGCVSGYSANSTYQNINSNCSTSGGIRVGGLLGSTQGDKIYYSSQTGNISGSLYVGGITSYVSAGTTSILYTSYTGNIMSASTLGFVGGLIGYSVNASSILMIGNSSVTGNLQGATVGGIGGQSYSAKMKNVYYKGQISASTKGGGFFGNYFSSNSGTDIFSASYNVTSFDTSNTGSYALISPSLTCPANGINNVYTDSTYSSYLANTTCTGTYSTQSTSVLKDASTLPNAGWPSYYWNFSSGSYPSLNY